MKRYYRTRGEAQRALKGWERKSILQPFKVDLKVRKVGTGSRTFVIATDEELWMKRTHELPLTSL
jgi:hypothetical protein